MDYKVVQQEHFFGRDLQCPKLITINAEPLLSLFSTQSSSPASAEWPRKYRNGPAGAISESLCTSPGKG